MFNLEEGQNSYFQIGQAEARKFFTKSKESIFSTSLEGVILQWRECFKRSIHTHSKFNFISKGGDMLHFKAQHKYIIKECMIQFTHLNTFCYDFGIYNVPKSKLAIYQIKKR